MAGIERELVLKDKFSSVFDKFIGKIERAVQATEKQEKVSNSVRRIVESNCEKMMSTLENMENEREKKQVRLLAALGHLGIGAVKILG